MSDEREASPPTRRDWEPMILSYQGTVSEVVQGGGGKLPTNTADMGDIRKPAGGM